MLTTISHPGLSRTIILTLLPLICLFLSLASACFGDPLGATPLTNGYKSASSVDVVDFPKRVRQTLDKLYTGMTRKRVERFLRPVGGWGYGERYYVPGLVVESKLVVIKIAFQPGDMPDMVYKSERLRMEWIKNHDRDGRWSDAVVRQIGKPFLSAGAID